MDTSSAELLKYYEVYETIGSGKVSPFRVDPTLVRVCVCLSLSVVDNGSF